MGEFHPISGGNGASLAGKPPAYETKASAVDAIVGGPTVIDSMTVSPVAGTYMVHFECQQIKTTAGSTESKVGIYVNGVLVTDTERTRAAGNSNGHFGAHGIVTVLSGEAVDIRATCPASVDFEGRSLTLGHVTPV